MCSQFDFLIPANKFYYVSINIYYIFVYKYTFFLFFLNLPPDFGFSNNFKQSWYSQTSNWNSLEGSAVTVFLTEMLHDLCWMGVAGGTSDILLHILV